MGTTCVDVAAIVEEVLGGVSDGTEDEQAASTANMATSVRSVALCRPRSPPDLN
jgi:hypothetical protein